MRPREDWAVGTEYEKLALARGTYASLPYDGPQSVRAILDYMADHFGWSRVFEGEFLVGLERGDATITTEPGGQIEFSGPPLRSGPAICAELSGHGEELRQVSDALGVVWLWTGLAPLRPLASIPLMPKGRYRIMDAYLPTRGKLARRMMRQTCSVQVNLDFCSEADGIRKMRAAYGVAPIVTAIFANSPFLEGRPTGYRSYRAHIWLHTDPDRCGLLPWVFRDDASFADYGEFALDTPMFFVVRDGRYHDLSGLPFRRYLEEGADGLTPTWDDWTTHLSTLFPDVRLKTHLELRGADAVRPPMLCGLQALWRGILYDDDATAAAWELVAARSLEEHQAVREDVARNGFDAFFGPDRVGDLARELVAIARVGLGRQGWLDCSATSPYSFLEPIEEVVADGKTPADRQIEIFEANGGGRRGIAAVMESCQHEGACPRRRPAFPAASAAGRGA